MVAITPSNLSNGGSMHQKQPPAKIAVAVSLPVSAETSIFSENNTLATMANSKASSV
jgi:hypothetical protein